MKQNTSTPSFFSLRGAEGRGVSPVEWSPECDFNQHQHQFSKVELSRPPPISTETRRVSNASSGNTASSNSLSCIPSSVSLSSSSSSVETKTNDDVDEISQSGSITDEDDPIISLEALSLDTQNISLVDKPKGRITGKTLFQSKSVLLEEQYQRQNRGNISTRVRKGMNLPREKEQDRRKPPIESLNLDSSFQRRRSAEQINIVPFALFSDDSSALPNSLQRRAATKKYTIKQNTNATRNTTVSELDAQKVPRTKRQRGGSDFTMTSASDIGSSTNNRCDRSASPSSPRKRRRVNRNRAMAAEDFDSILSQINTTGSL